MLQADSGEVTSGLVTNSWTTRRVMKLNTGDRCRGAWVGDICILYLCI